MARHVVDQVLARQSHEVIAHVPDEVFGLVLPPAHPHVAVDRAEALGNRAAPLDRRLLDQDDLEVPAPVARVEGSAAAGEPPSDDQKVAVDNPGY